MGGAIARNLVAAGWHVIGYDIERGADAGRPKRAGVEIANDAAAVAAAAPNILISLPKPAGAAWKPCEAIAAAKLHAQGAWPK